MVNHQIDLAAFHQTAAVPLDNVPNVQENPEEQVEQPGMKVMEVEGGMGTEEDLPNEDAIGGVEGEGDEVLRLRQLVQTLQAEKEAALRQHAAELEGQRARVKALMDENARLIAREADLVARERRLSTDEIPPLDVVVERATYGADEDRPGPNNANEFRVRSRSLFPSVGGATLDIMRARAERAEAEVGSTKVHVEELTNAMRGFGTSHQQSRGKCGAAYYSSSWLGAGP